MEKKENTEAHLKAAQQYMKVFDPFLEENPPYVPEDGAALYFSRVYFRIDDGPTGFCYYPEHKTLEDLKKEKNMQYTCAHEFEGRKLGITIHNCVYPGKEPGRNVQEDEYALATMGALGETPKEILKGELPCEELRREMEPEQRKAIEEEGKKIRRELCSSAVEKQGMNADLFWNIISEVNQSVDPKDQKAVLEATIRKLMEFSAEDICRWHQIKGEYMDLADRNDLWEACAKAGAHCTDEVILCRISP